MFSNGKRARKLQIDDLLAIPRHLERGILERLPPRLYKNIHCTALGIRLEARAGLEN